MIEHIMHAVMRFSERVICLETGQITEARRGTSSIIRRSRRVYFGEQARR